MEKTLAAQHFSLHTGWCIMLQNPNCEDGYAPSGCTPLKKKKKKKGEEGGGGRSTPAVCTRDA